MPVNEKYSESDLPYPVGKIYQRKNKAWIISGYTCPLCSKSYSSLRIEFIRHLDKCDGPETKKSLED